MGNGLPRLLIALLLALCVAGCEQAAPLPAASSKTIAAIPAAPRQAGEPIIRVRLTRQTQQILFTGPTRLQVFAVDKPDQKLLISTPATIQRAGGIWQGPWTGAPFAAGAILEIQPLGPSILRIDHTPYVGTCRLTPVASSAAIAAAELPDAGPEIADDTLPPDVLGAQRQPAPSPRPAAPPRIPVADRFDVINYVRIEAYLPGVLQGELYEHWEPAAFLAQAIAARSYAIDRIISFGPGNNFDVDAGQSSQAYVGASVSPLALRAVTDSAGLVLTWNNHILPAYYSSACGGAALSPRDAFNIAQVYAPLEPSHTRTCCAGTPHFNWGPQTEDLTALTKRIKAWGAANRMSVANMTALRGARISKINSLGRPVEFELTDDRNKTYPIRAEFFRNACNYSNEAAKVPAPKQKLRSSFFNVRVENDKVIFFDGHGFGHGVGLCQYGAQAMARAGKDPLQILAEYYPGAKVERAY